METLLERCQDKYPHHRDFGMMALEALVDFSTADQQADIQTTPPVAWAEARTFFQQEVRRIGRRWFEA